MDSWRQRIVLVPLGPVQDEVLEFLGMRLSGATGADVAVGEGLSLGVLKAGGRRSSLEGGAVLSILRRMFDGRGFTLGIVDEECCSCRGESIDGRAALGGGCGFVSLCRMRGEVSGRSTDSAFLERVLGEALHQVGHGSGLLHCPEEGCVMSGRTRGARSVVYCECCSGLLEQMRIY